MFFYNSINAINILQKMGYKIKIQRVDRKTTKSFYVNFPAAVALASNI